MGYGTYHRNHPSNHYHQTRGKIVGTVKTGFSFVEKFSEGSVLFAILYIRGRGVNNIEGLQLFVITIT